MWEWLILGATCVIAATCAVRLLAPRRTRSGGLSALFDAGRNVPPVWLFEGGTLLDMNHAARDFAADGERMGDWTSLRDSLRPRFPDFPDTPEDPGKPVIVESAPGHAPMQAVCEWLDDVIRVQLRPRPVLPGQEVQPAADVPLSASSHAPYPVWQLDEDNRVSWHNATYARLYRTVHQTSPDPETPLFDIEPDEAAKEKTARRAISVDGGDRQLWFDVSIVPLGSGRLCYGVDVNAVVDAEIAQRNFVQTLAKTFAHLSIGLAIFDRNRQLVMFNPALMDLTALQVDFLSARPNLLSFFDRLRDQRMMPEPKNYGSWRQQMADLVAAADDGRYQETWSLPSGSVYSVTGRPHPDGAVAFLFEDITAEITLTRRFRSDLELGQSVLDQLDQAIAVFSGDGTMSFNNAAYRRLWDTDPDRSFAQTTVLDATRLWQDKCRATPIWGEIRDFVATRENRAEWFNEFRLADGTEMICAIHPVEGGATMVSFERPFSATRPAPQQPEMQLADA